MIIKAVSVFLIFDFYSQYQIVFATQSSDSTEVIHHSLTKIEKDLRGSSIWYIRVGYFPPTEDFSSGLSYLLGSEHKISKYLNLGWQVQLVNVFKRKDNFSGYLSLFMTIEHDFKIANELFFLRGGIGLNAISPGIAGAGLLELEYVAYSFEGLALAISASQTFIRFKNLGPTIISVGIIF
ncbi:MAG TPA: hypothetical protein VK870_06180 [Ignavibacteriaceae bacterium]|nr:hypothetical protein [Ignavibacteriaceae bacterium]